MSALTSEQVRALETAGRLGGIHAMADLCVDMTPGLREALDEASAIRAAVGQCEAIANEAGFDPYQSATVSGASANTSSLAAILKQKYPQQNINALAFSKSPFYAMVRK